MKKNAKLNEIESKLEKHKAESEIRSNFINGRVQALNYRLLKDNDGLDYQKYSFIKIVVSIKSLSPNMDEDIRCRFAEMWLNHKLFFKKKRFECVIFALTWYCTLLDNQPIDESELVEMFFKDKDQPAMLLQVFQCESRIREYYEDKEQSI
ncbi:hypothetical protein [Methanosarcina sp. UBA5]|uniref:hypothetical protein n=1 Tax=Methanosarcina sp. UBA5 TaxID=1915593 RepID=UPI0025F689BB|nr:hypothetical protein [Methanosarcina sp. UBA5]